jgi:hypothetical protein
MNSQGFDTHNMAKFKIFMTSKSLETFWCFDVTLITNHKIYYKENNGELFPSLGWSVYYQLGSHGLFAYHFIL